MRIGIYGYGNLAKGVECAIKKSPDMELAAVFTRRDPSQLSLGTPDVPVVSVQDVESWTDKIDVMVLCGGSATDLPEMTPALAKLFNVIDSYDNHSHIPEHFQAVDAAAAASGADASQNRNTQGLHRVIARYIEIGVGEIRYVHKSGEAAADAAESVCDKTHVRRIDTCDLCGFLIRSDRVDLAAGLCLAENESYDDVHEHEHQNAAADTEYLLRREVPDALVQKV